MPVIDASRAARSRRRVMWHARPQATSRGGSAARREQQKAKCPRVPSRPLAPAVRRTKHCTRRPKQRPRGAQTSREKGCPPPRRNDFRSAGSPPPSAIVVTEARAIRVRTRAARATRAQETRGPSPSDLQQESLVVAATPPRRRRASRPHWTNAQPPRRRRVCARGEGRPARVVRARRARVSRLPQPPPPVRRVRPAGDARRGHGPPPLRRLDRSERVGRRTGQPPARRNAALRTAPEVGRRGADARRTEPAFNLSHGRNRPARGARV
mmetsp:Transcript_30442/g.94210  ORF Transcript_30442/g.94210 Transcript_30442/m.94210 type:complete len:268 (-) Transcript_30442:1410-2213(-)